MQQGGWLQTVLPFAIIALVMWRRWKMVGKAVPLRSGRMWILPVIVTVLIGLMLYAMPPSPTGWAVFALGLAIGLIVGWQRARLMHFERDEATGAVLVKQTPLAFLFIVALFLMRRLLVPDANRAGTGKGAAPALPLITDALLGFALGMIIGMRIEMWRRARALAAS